MRKEDSIFISSMLMMVFIAGMVIGVLASLLYMGINPQLEKQEVTTPTNCFPLK